MVKKTDEPRWLWVVLLVAAFAVLLWAGTKDETVTVHEPRPSFPTVSR